MRVDVRDVIKAVEARTAPWTALEIKSLLLKLAIQEDDVKRSVNPANLAGFARD